MKAICYSDYGPPEVLQVREVSRPAPGDDEMLVRVRAAEATKADCEMRSFRYAVKWFWLPLRLAFGIRKPRRRILGSYFSGQVVSLGKGVTEFSEGEGVFGSTSLRLGAYGQYVAVPKTSTLLAKPANMTFEEAAAVPLGGLNALHFMRRAEIRPGQKVLINGAGGSIGAHAVQIAKAMGAEVTAVDTTVKEAMLRRLGVDYFVDYKKESFTDVGRTYDVIFDMVPGHSRAACMRVLNPGGCYLSGNPTLATMLLSVITNRFTDKRALFAFARETKEELATLRDMIEAGQIRSIVDRVFPMAGAVEAHRLVETERRRGAIVIVLDAEDRTTT